MGATLRPPYTAPACFAPKISDDIDGANPQCAPSANPTSETAAKTPPRTGATRNANAPIATTACATHSAAGRGTART